MHRPSDRDVNWMSPVQGKSPPVQVKEPYGNLDMVSCRQGCGNTMPDLSDLVPFHSGQVDNFNLLVLGQVQNLYKVNKILYLIF